MAEYLYPWQPHVMIHHPWVMPLFLGVAASLLAWVSYLVKK